MKSLLSSFFILFSLSTYSQWTSPDANGNIENTNSGNVTVKNKFTVMDNITNVSQVPSYGRWSLFSYANATHTGTVDSGITGGYIISLNGPGNLKSSIGLHAVAGVESSGTGTVTDAYGVYASVQKGLGTVTNGYGLYIRDIAATNQYGVYQSGSSDKNYFAGNVGIGTVNPQSGLHLLSDNGIIIDDSESGHAGSIKMTDGFTNTTTKDDMLFEANGGFLFRLDKNDNGISNQPGFGVYDKNDAAVLFARDNGRVGVGTVTPYAKLDVHGAIRSTDGNDNVTLRSINANNYSEIVWGDDTNDRFRFFYNYWNGTDQDKEVMSLLANGNVGIGTPTPDSKLTVAGNIHSREVKVTVNAGADFVFDKDYNLPKLDDVQKFINENGHLPEIASAKDMEENGIHLSEMNIKLLQKIEELTLYTIEQEKKLKEQEEESILQKKEIEEIKKQLNQLIKNIKS